MNILMLTEYFPPFDFGGSEWSTYYLAKGLSERGFNVTILTPNYGKEKNKEVKEGFLIYRPSFYIKINKKKQLTPYWHTNIAWFIWSAFCTIKYCLKNKIDIIHIQGKYFLPAAILAKIILRKKIITTLRDYIILCPLSMCLLYENKICTLKKYIVNDIPKMIKIYHKDKNLIIKFFLYLSALRLKIVSIFLKKLLKYTDDIISISDIEKKIYEKEGFKNISIITNPYLFKTLRKTKKSKEKNKIIFAGRLTPGKGADMLIKIIPMVIKKFKNVIFYFIGEGFLKKDLINESKKNRLSSNIKFLGYLDHNKLQKYLRTAAITVMPSLWPEPFGRVVLESLGVGTPVVVSDRCGVSENVINKRWGVISRPNKDEFVKSIIFALKNKEIMRENLYNDYKLMKNIWSDNVYNLHIKIYNRIVKLPVR